MALNYTLKKEPVMDGSEVVATVRGLSLNDIIELIILNKESMNGLFDQFSERDPDSITEGEIVSTGLGLLTTAPMFIAQIIAVASEAWEDYEDDGDKENPLNTILSMPTGMQIAFLEKIGMMTFNAANPPKKILALALKMAQGAGRDQLT